MRRKSFIKTICILVLSLIMTTTMVFADNISQVQGNGNIIIFSDVSTNFWAKDAIDYFTSQGVVSGMPDGKFHPNDGVTREQFARMLVGAFDPELETPNTPTFKDVAENRWSYPYIETCKDYLTAYTNPMGGLPSFHPAEFATREDIAVALVRMIGLTDKDAKDPYLAARRFPDATEISPGLVGYVSVAVEKGIFSGRPDGTFGPTDGITRAETVVVLNKVLKQAVTSINAELELTAKVVYGQDPKKVTISITTIEGAKVSVDGNNVVVGNNGYNQYQGAYTYTFEQEGSKTFNITASKAGKTNQIQVVAKYEESAPTLNVTSAPTTSNVKTVEISGTVSDKADKNVIVTVNGEKAYTLYSGSSNWSKTLTLAEGENKITIVATNSLGKSTTVEKIITFGVAGPTVVVTYAPTTSNVRTVEITGTVSDKNDKNVIVTVNGEKAYALYSGSSNWSKSLDLVEGDNKITIVATNNLGKSTTIEKIITFGVAGPTVVVTYAPTTSNVRTVEITGTVSDKNDKNTIVTVNGEKAYALYSGSSNWSKTVTLAEGENKITIVATNNLGKSTTIEKIITFEVAGPTVVVTYAPSTSNVKNVEITGTVSDKNDKNVVVTVNGEKAYTLYSGSSNWSKTITLVEGENKITIAATNNLGKTTTVEKTIVYTVTTP